MRTFSCGFFTVLMLALVLAAPARAADDNDSLQNTQVMKVIDRGTIKQVLKSDMIMLDNDRRYRLENILVPPFEDGAAITGLKQYLHTPVVVYSYQEPDDIFEDISVVPYAHIVVNKGVWLQQDMIANGLAWVYCTETSPQTAGVLKQTEEKARVDNVGLWKNPAYAIKTPDDVGDFINSYQIVEGKITGVKSTLSTSTVVFSFGKGKTRKFGVMFRNTPQMADLWYGPSPDQKSVRDIQQWKGRNVRVRGWVKDEGLGPVMELTNKEQLDVLMKKEY